LEGHKKGPDRRGTQRAVCGVTMAILLQQDFSQPNDEKGMRNSIKPQHIRSGTYFNQMQLRGSILVIKDNLNTESGYLAFGSSMTAIPTSPSTGTGIYIDYRGI
jgi:hypothetical protein